jgi:hypothetical protein
VKNEHEETAYGRWLSAGTHLGLLALVAAFLLYVSGVLDPLVPFDRLPSVWSLPVDRYVALTGWPTGWGWLGSLARADALSVGGVALLSAVTIACYARILPELLRRGERVQAALAVAQILVLLAAASGIFAATH